MDAVMHERIRRAHGGRPLPPSDEVRNREITQQFVDDMIEAARDTCRAGRIFSVETWVREVVCVDEGRH